MSKIKIEEALSKGYSSNYHMEEYNHDNECCICHNKAKWHKNGVGLFCDEHKKEYQKKYKEKYCGEKHFTEADRQTWMNL